VTETVDLFCCIYYEVIISLQCTFRCDLASRCCARRASASTDIDAVRSATIHGIDRRSADTVARCAVCAGISVERRTSTPRSTNTRPGARTCVSGRASRASGSAATAICRATFTAFQTQRAAPRSRPVATTSATSQHCSNAVLPSTCHVHR